MERSTFHVAVVQFLAGRSLARDALAQLASETSLAWYERLERAELELVLARVRRAAGEVVSARARVRRAGAELEALVVAHPGATIERRIAVAKRDLAALTVGRGGVR